MQLQPLENIGERLLRAGVAPRHVHRYVRELRDHYEDAMLEELAKGLSRATSEQAAWARLGAEDHLAQSVLAQPELRSTAARYPGLVYGAGPALIWMGSFLLTFFALVLLSEAFTLPTGQEPGWILSSAYALCIFYMRILPVIFGIAILIAAARQRLIPRWPIVGAAIVAVLGGTTRVDLTLAAHLGEKSQLAVNSSLLPFIFPSSNVLGRMDVLALDAGLARAVFMLAITLALYLFWRRCQQTLQAKSLRSSNGTAGRS